MAVALACYSLIHDDLRIVVGIVVDPGGLIGWHVDTAVCAVIGTGIAARIDVVELGAGAVVRTPPGVVQEVSAGVIHDGVVNRRVRVPVG